MTDYLPERAIFEEMISKGGQTAQRGEILLNLLPLWRQLAAESPLARGEHANYCSEGAYVMGVMIGETLRPGDTEDALRMFMDNLALFQMEFTRGYGAAIQAQMKVPKGEPN